MRTKEETSEIARRTLHVERLVAELGVARWDRLAPLSWRESCLDFSATLDGLFQGDLASMFVSPMDAECTLVLKAPAPTSREAYLAALHEMGHAATTPYQELFGSFLMFGCWALLPDVGRWEALAWEWALDELERRDDLLPDDVSFALDVLDKSYPAPISEEGREAWDRLHAR